MQGRPGLLSRETLLQILEKPLLNIPDHRTLHSHLFGGSLSRLSAPGLA